VTIGVTGFSSEEEVSSVIIIIAGVLWRVNCKQNQKLELGTTNHDFRQRIRPLRLPGLIFNRTTVFLNRLRSCKPLIVVVTVTYRAGSGSRGRCSDV